MTMGPKPRPEHERFFAKVTPADDGDCWLWSAATAGGYGRFLLADHRLTPAHRWAYEHLIGPIPSGLELDHLCFVRNCVNPWHLDPVPKAVNAARGSARAPRPHAPRCVNGHSRAPENIAVHASGNRVCKDCQRERGQRRRAAGRAA